MEKSNIYVSDNKTTLLFYFDGDPMSILYPITGVAQHALIPEVYGIVPIFSVSQAVFEMNSKLN